MKWILLCLLLRADGAITDTRVELPSKEACEQAGKAWQAQANHGNDGVASFVCSKR